MMLKKIISFTLILTFLFVYVPTNAAEMAGTNPYEAIRTKEGTEAIALEYGDSILSNGQIDIIYDSAGLFTLGVNNRRLLFGSSPGTSYTTININGTYYEFHADNVTATDSEVIATQDINGVIVTQRLSIEPNYETGSNDNIKISYDIKNNSGAPVEAGIRILLDTMVSDNDDAPFYIPGYGRVNNEVEFSGDNIPHDWYAYDNFDNTSMISKGIFWDSNSVKPDLVKFARWDYIKSLPWNYTLGDFSFGDSSVAVYYNPVTIETGAQRNYYTQYGVGSVDNTTNENVGLTVFAPEKMIVNSNSTDYINNPITISGYIENYRSTDLNNVNVRIELPPEMILVSGSEEINIPSVAAYDAENIEWTVEMSRLTHDTDLNYRILYSADGLDERYLNKSISVPAVKSLEEGSYIKLGNNRLWRCIERTNDLRCLVMPVSNLEYNAYDSDSSTYSDSDVHKWLNDNIGEIFGNYSTTKQDEFIYDSITREILNRSEADKIETGAAVYLSDTIDTISDSYYSASARDLVSKIFLPSVEDINKAYQLDHDFYKSWGSDEDYINQADSHEVGYWLSTPYNNGEENDKVDIIKDSVNVGSASVTDATIGIRPAMYLYNLSQAVLRGEGTLEDPYTIQFYTSGGGGAPDDYIPDEDGGGSGTSKTSSGGDIEEEYMLEDVVNVEIADEFMDEVFGELSDEEVEINDDLVTLLGEEAIARAARLNVHTDELVINDELIKDIVPVLEDAYELVVDKMENKLELRRRPRKNIRIYVPDRKEISIEKLDISDKYDIDEIIVVTPYASVSFEKDNVEKLVLRNEGEVLTEVITEATTQSATEKKGTYSRSYSTNNSGERKIVEKGSSVYSLKNIKNSEKLYGSLENIIDKSTHKISIDFENVSDDSTSTVKVLFNNIADGQYKAVLNEDGDAIGGKYNPITGEMSAKINESGVFSVEENKKDFEDIKGYSNDIQTAISTLASKGVITGTAEGEFSPDSSITRAELAALVLRVIVKLDPNADGGFDDVTKSDWFFGTAGSSKKNNIILGFEDNTFRGKEVILKDQITAVTARTLVNEMKYIYPEDIEKVLSIYSDADEIDKWAKDDIALLTDAGGVILSSDGTFNAKTEMKRADAALLIYDLFNKLW